MKWASICLIVHMSYFVCLFFPWAIFGPITMLVTCGIWLLSHFLWHLLFHHFTPPRSWFFFFQCIHTWCILIFQLCHSLHGDVIKWKHFPGYWPFARGIPPPPPPPPHTHTHTQRPVARSFDVFFDLRPMKQLSKQLRRRWFETPSRSLWRHCNEKNDMIALN